MELTIAEKQHFRDQGYVVLRGAIPPRRIAAARQVINHSLGEQGIPPDDLPKLRQTSYCGEERQNPVLTDLFNRSVVFTAFESVFGEGNVQRTGGAQIALRFPRPLYQQAKPPHGHLDGIGTGLNNMEKGAYSRSFTALAVVLLNDLPEPYWGNFTVWPRSHTAFEAYFKEHGHGEMASGMPKIEYPEGPLQMTGKAGDVVLAHHLMVHGAAPNTGPEIRYAAIFRARHSDVEKNDKDAYTDMWREWPGIRALED